MGHRHPKSERRVQRDQMLQTEKKVRRQAKKDRTKERWANDVEYQKQQTERLSKLKAKKGYEQNIEQGVDNKEASRIHRIERKKRRVESLKRRR